MFGVDAKHSEITLSNSPSSTTECVFKLNPNLVSLYCTVRGDFCERNAISSNVNPFSNKQNNYDKLNSKNSEIKKKYPSVT